MLFAGYNAVRGHSKTPRAPNCFVRARRSVRAGVGLSRFQRQVSTYPLPVRTPFSVVGRRTTHNFLRRLALPRSVKHWSLTTLREKLVKIGAKVARHSKYVTFQMAEVAVPRELFDAILERIQRFGVPPPLLQHR